MRQIILNNLKDLIITLKEGVTTITFEKIGTGEVRVMPCTLNRDLMGTNAFSIENINSQSKSIVVYALDKKDIRDVMVDTITSWHKGSPDA